MDDRAAVIKLKNLSKRYPRSKFDAVHKLSLSVRRGEVYGFLGPNGAGKTTTISMMVNLLAPSAGSIRIFGKDALTEGEAIRARVGYLPGDMALDGPLSGRQQLEYFGNLHGGFDKSYVTKLSDRLNCDLRKKTGALSRGNRQKIGLIAALMHRPELLILDEPTSGLDPLVQAEFNKIILEHKAAGGTTFISSHVLSEVQQLCDRVGIIKNGKLVVDKPLDYILGSAPKQVRLSLAGAKPREVTAHLAGAHNVLIHDHAVTFTFKGDINQLLKRLHKEQVTDLTIEPADLEQIFMEYYQGESNV